MTSTQDSTSSPHFNSPGLAVRGNFLRWFDRWKSSIGWETRQEHMKREG